MKTIEIELLVEILQGLEEKELDKFELLDLFETYANGTEELTMWHHEIIEKLRKNLTELPSDMIEYNLGYAAAISDLEHIAEEKGMQK